MYTEDDTFRKLRQMPFEQLDMEYFKANLYQPGAVRSNQDRNKWFEERGWTWNEYVKAHPSTKVIKRFKSLR